MGSADRPNTALLNGSYEVLGELGAGAFGKVLLARDVLVNHSVAIKVLQNERSSPDTLIREMQFLASLNHPGVVIFHHHFQHEGRLHLVMEYCAGGSLRDRLADGPVAEDIAIGWIKTLADTLGFVHSQGIVHHDIKPDNVVFGADDNIKIGDFGIANQLGGTLWYLAPEVHLGPISEKDQCVDVYALGMTLVELLAGELPFLGMPPGEILSRKELRNFVPRTLEGWLREAVLKAIHPSPELRFQNMAEFKEAVETHHVRYVVNANRVRAHALAVDAEASMAQHRLGRARKRVLQALHFDKNSIPALVAAGRYSLLAGLLEDAESYFSQAISANPRTQIQKELGWLALERRDYSYAISMLNDHLHRYSSDYEAANLLVQCFFDLDRFGYAKALCEMMLKTQPKNACFRNNRFISVLMETGELAEAIQSLGGQELADPFMRYNRRIAEFGPENLKRKLLFQDYRFGDPAIARPSNSNTLILRRTEASRFSNPVVAIGRDPSNDYVLDVSDVSRWHCVVVNFRENVWLYDLNSTHGTSLDGKPFGGRIRIDGLHEVRAASATFAIVSTEGRLV